VVHQIKPAVEPAVVGNIAFELREAGGRTVKPRMFAPQILEQVCSFLRDGPIDRAEGDE
jgi:hypothetical protein